MFVFGVFLWTIYGYINNDMPVLLANVVTFVLESIILFYKMRNKVSLQERSL